MADKKTSQEPAASELDGTELVRIVQDGVNKKATVSQFKNPITVDYLTLSQLTVDHAVIEGQVYKYVDATFLPASIDHILLTGSGTQTYNNICQIKYVSLSKYIQSEFELDYNEFYVIPSLTMTDAYTLQSDLSLIDGTRYKIMIEDDGVDYLLTEVVTVLGGTTPVFSRNCKAVMNDGNVIDCYYDVDTYKLVVTREINLLIEWITPSNIWQLTEVGVNTCGTVINTASNPSSGECRLVFDSSWMKDTVTVTFNSTNNSGLTTFVMYGYYLNDQNTISIYGSENATLSEDAWQYNPVIVNIKNTLVKSYD